MNRKTVKIILIVIALIMVLLGGIYALNGSLEAFPTDEQQAKARIMAGLLIACGVIIGIVGVVIKSAKIREIERDR